jgi:hypothetical protein
MIIAEATDTALALSLTVSDANGGATGLTATCAVYDQSAVTNKWLNMTRGSWQPGKDTKVMTEVGDGSYVTTANVSNSASTHIMAYYEITVGGSGVAQDEIVLINTLDVATDADATLILADTADIQPKVATGESAWVTATGFATEAKQDIIDSNVDLVLADTAVMQPQIAAGVSNWLTATGFATAGDAMTLTAQAELDVVDAIWDEDGADHLTAGTTGYLQDQAATGGAGVTPLQIEQAVWNAVQASYTTEGSMGAAMASSGEVPAALTAALNRYFQIVRRYGPIAAKQPIATRDEVHVDDVGIILTIPIILDGAYSDLSDATSINFDFTAPSGATAQKAGAGVTTPTGSYTTLTSDAEVFDEVGRWRVQVTVTWPDVSTKASDIYAVDIQPPMPSL